LDTARIVITGGPATGKTSIITALEHSGYFCFEEIIRKMTKRVKAQEKSTVFASNPIVSVANPLNFNSQILEARIQQFKEAPENCTKSVFYDRGIPDVIAYMDFFSQQYNLKFENACKKYRYDLVFILPPWEAIFTLDSERFENFEEATGIYHSLEKVYRLFGYQPIPVSFGSIEERVRFILEHINV